MFVKHYSKMQKANVVKKKLSFKHILTRRRREKIIDEIEDALNDEGHA